MRSSWETLRAGLLRSIQDREARATFDELKSRSEAFERGRTRIEVTVRLPRSQVRYVRGARIVEDGERPTVIAQYNGLDHACHALLAYGAQVEVLAPSELRERIAAAAAETAALYAADG